MARSCGIRDANKDDEGNTEAWGNRKSRNNRSKLRSTKLKEKRIDFLKKVMAEAMKMRDEQRFREELRKRKMKIKKKIGNNQE